MLCDPDRVRSVWWAVALCVVDVTWWCVVVADDVCVGLCVWLCQVTRFIKEQRQKLYCLLSGQLVWRDECRVHQCLLRHGLEESVRHAPLVMVVGSKTTCSWRSMCVSWSIALASWRWVVFVPGNFHWPVGIGLFHDGDGVKQSAGD